MHAKWGAASPRTLSRLLSAVSPRATSPAWTPEHHSRLTSEWGDKSPPQELDVDDQVAPIDLSDTEVQFDSLSGQGTLYEQEQDGQDDLPPSISPKAVHTESSLSSGAGGAGLSGAGDDKSDERALRDGLQGLWRLWRGTKRQPDFGDDEEKDRFLQVVREVIGRQ